ncbi:peptide-methionine (R)-S-oxide reductase [Yoonia sp.]|uniref:peptide-methionine (R)-S-oxide reductase n=1 Tax=Yoonia sp. TaxID=2212373 RepID=UPI003F6B435B
MTSIHRRDLLRGSTILAGALALPKAGHADVPAGRDPFNYQITRTDAEWRARLGEDYAILREGSTEMPMSSDIWAESRKGRYDCRGCGLTQYRWDTKVNLPKGWLFFVASEPNAQLMSQDISGDMSAERNILNTEIEVHCRRCGSHMGHILLVEEQVLHCINGASLDFVQAA